MAGAREDLYEINGRLEKAPFFFVVRIAGLKGHEYQYQFYDLVGDRKNILGRRRWKVTGRNKLWKYVAGIEEGKKR